MTVIQYDPVILAKFPHICGGMIVANEIKNRPTPDSLKARFFEEQETVRERVGNHSLAEIPALSAWRSSFRAFGSDPTKYRCAAESLTRRLVKKGDIPSINMLVDMGNLVSIRYSLPLSVMDLRHVQGAITVRFADGNQHYRELNSDEVIYPEAGEVVFSDETGMIMARRWCWRQSDESASREDTTRALVTIEAQHEGGRVDVEAATKDMLDLLREYSGGEFRHAILDKENPAIS